jgi:hypothetical protein
MFDSIVATQVVTRIEGGIAADRQSISRRRSMWKRSWAVLRSFVGFITLASLIVVATLLAIMVVGLFALIIFA